MRQNVIISLDVSDDKFNCQNNQKTAVSYWSKQNLRLNIWLDSNKIFSVGRFLCRAVTDLLWLRYYTNSSMAGNRKVIWLHYEDSRSIVILSLRGHFQWMIVRSRGLVLSELHEPHHRSSYEGLLCLFWLQDLPVFESPEISIRP